MLYFPLPLIQIQIKSINQSSIQHVDLPVSSTSREIPCPFFVFIFPYRTALIPYRTVPVKYPYRTGYGKNTGFYGPVRIREKIAVDTSILQGKIKEKREHHSSEP